MKSNKIFNKLLVRFASDTTFAFLRSKNVAIVKWIIDYRGKAKYLIGVILDPVLAVFHDFGKKVQLQKCKKNIICIFKNGKNSILAPEKNLKLPKMQFSDWKKQDFW